MTVKLITMPVRSNGLWIDVKRKRSRGSMRMIEVIEAAILIIAIVGHSILCFYGGYRFRQGEEDNG